MKVLNKTWKLNLLFCCFAATLMAQQTPFKYRAPIAAVDTAGYYRINLQPGLTAKAKTNLSDIRIAGPDGKFVAYAKDSDMPSFKTARFVPFPPVKTNSKPDSNTVYIVQNTSGMAISSLNINLKNTGVQRRLAISGSDDLKNWFAISENITLGIAGKTDTNGLYKQDLVFPASSYRYLKLAIHNGQNNPLNILEAGIYTYQPAKPQYVAIPGLTFKQVDSPNHITHIYLSFDQAYPINQVCIPVDPRIMFHRQLNVYTNDARHQWLTSKTFRNDDTCINLAVKTRQLDIQIVNNDDQPLPVKKVEAFQTQSYIIARLNPQKAYCLVFGNDTIPAPRYDLRYFAEKVGNALPTIEHLAVTRNPAFQPSAPSAGKSYPYVLWISVALAVLLLLSLTIKMAREVKKREA